MREQFKIVYPLAHPHWNGLVATAADYSIFHPDDWARVLHEAYGNRPPCKNFGNEGNRSFMEFIDREKPHMTWASLGGVKQAADKYNTLILHKGRKPKCGISYDNIQAW